MIKKVLKTLNIKFAENSSVLKNIKKGLEEMKLFKYENLKTTPAKEFLNEL